MAYNHGLGMTTAIPQTVIERFWACTDVHGPDDCWRWKGGFSKGYGNFTCKATGSIGAHRMAFLIANGYLPSGRLLVIMHDCENSWCVNPKHLLIGTQKANNNYPGRIAKATGWNHTKQAKIKIGKALRGNNYARRHPESKILAIYRAVGKHSDIAAQFGVSQALVTMIKNGKRNSSVTRRSV